MIFKNIKCTLLLLPILLILISCNQSIDEKELIKQKLLELYTSKYGFENEPFYEPIFDEIYLDTIYRYYWELDSSHVESYLKIFNLFDNESISLRDESATYYLFGLVFKSNGQILGEGFFNEDGSFTGIEYFYDNNWQLTEKHTSKLDQNFYEVRYTLDRNGSIIDSSYNFFPIVFPDTDTFSGPNLHICFDVQLIVDTRKYNYEDFTLSYMFIDDKSIDNYQNYISEHERKTLNISRKSKDGYFHFCYDLDMNHHLWMAFGIFVGDGISDQNLTFGRFIDPIINKNVGSMEL